MPLPEPLYMAARNGEMELVVQLVNKRANLETRGFDDETPLLASVEDHHEELVRALLRAHADVLATDKFRQTALHKAARSGGTAVANLFAKAKADVNARDSLGMCPMHFAVLYGHEDVQRTLNCNGAERAPLCNRGLSPDDYRRDQGYRGAGLCK